MQKLVRSVPVGDFVTEYVAKLVRATRPKDPSAPEFVKRMVDWGAGPRAGIFLVQGGRAMAAMDGRFSVAIDDVKKVAIPVLRHRVSTNFQAQAEGKTSEDVIQKLLETVQPPEIGKYDKKRKWNMKPKVYVETSVIGYLTRWPSGDLIVAARQKITRDWWRDAPAKYDLIASERVVREASAGDPQAVQDRLAVLQGLPVARSLPNKLRILWTPWWPREPCRPPNRKMQCTLLWPPLTG